MNPVPTALATPTSAYHGAIDQIELAMLAHPALYCPVTHTFTPGLYAREIRMPAGALVTSRIHKTEHPFVVSKGRVTVYTEDGRVEIEAPYTGITKPGTRRVLMIHEDTIWTTFHVTNETDVAVIEDQIIDKHTEHLDGRRHSDGRLPAAYYPGGGPEFEGATS